jgi:hypothetical protein
MSGCTTRTCGCVDLDYSNALTIHTAHNHEDVCFQPEFSEPLFGYGICTGSLMRWRHGACCSTCTASMQLHFSVGASDLERQHQARCQSPTVTWASTRTQVTCAQQDACFITEMQKRDATELSCTVIPSLKASYQLRALRVWSSCSSCNCTGAGLWQPNGALTTVLSVTPTTYE